VIVGLLIWKSLFLSYGIWIRRKEKFRNFEDFYFETWIGKKTQAKKELEKISRKRIDFNIWKIISIEICIRESCKLDQHESERFLSQMRRHLKKMKISEKNGENFFETWIIHKVKVTKQREFFLIQISWESSAIESYATHHHSTCLHFYRMISNLWNSKNFDHGWWNPRSRESWSENFEEPDLGK